MEIIKPYNDDAMIYDYKRHRYRLTPKGVLDELGENLSLILDDTADANPSALPDRWLKRSADAVYRYIYKDNPNPRQIEYLLAKCAPLRDRIKDALFEQALYNLENGFLGLYSGVNESKASAVDLWRLRGAVAVCEAVEDFASNIIPELGHSLKFLGRLCWDVPECDRYKDY